MKRMPRQGRPWLKKMGIGVSILVGLETAAFIGSYVAWRKMNRDIEFRHKVYDMSPQLLDYYYKVGEKIGGISTRASDYETWGVQQSR